MNNNSKGHQKIRIGVIFGGRSGEHEVSLMSAQSVLSALDTQKYDVIAIGIDKAGRWITGDVLPRLKSGSSIGPMATLLPDPQSSALMQIEAFESQPAAISVVSELDVIIPILHGTYGEDGTVQGLLELADLPYVGAGVVGSAVGMDKAIFKQVMTAAGIPVLPWALVTAREWAQKQPEVIARIEGSLPYPVFTKPANLGSSVGISKCRSRGELIAGLNLAARFDRRLVVEQGIDGRELEVAVLGNEEPVASIVGEVRPRRDFYDYIAKYVAEPDSEDESELFIPAEIDAEISQNVRDLALAAYMAIDCAGMGRVDLLMDKSDSRLYLNEINTIPGFTRISMYPKLWAASGLSYPELLDRLISLALERHAEKESLKTTFTLEDSD